MKKNTKKRKVSENVLFEGKKLHWKRVKFQDAELNSMERDGVYCIEELSETSDIEVDETLEGAVQNSEPLGGVEENDEPLGGVEENDEPLGTASDTVNDSRLNHNEAEAALWEDYSSLEDKMSKWIASSEDEAKLNPLILKALLNLGYMSPTPIQRLCLLPATLHRRDIIGAAETGSGKTMAFGVPICQNLLFAYQRGREKTPDWDFKGLQALILLPTRELAFQVQKDISAICEGSILKTLPIIGGMSIQRQTRLLKRQPHIVTATPARLWALMGGDQTQFTGETPESLQMLNLRHLVIDEADRMIEQGHFREIAFIVDSIHNQITREDQLQTFLFSATLTMTISNEIKKKKKKEKK
eukprot:GHVL01015088.1.p1 GENE.GHVL01015088.1~~GHVL01015088.1.p1  ORF type:complete len:357 (+),score=95.43 GHVL01015088.1:32-1102(+)